MALRQDSAVAALSTEVRFLNAVPALPSLILVKGDGSPEIHTASGTVTPYRPFIGEALQLALVRAHDLARATSKVPASPPNDGAQMGKEIAALDTLAVRREMIPRNGRYTIIAMPSDDGEGVTIRLVTDSVLPDTSVAQIRLIHAAPLAGEFDLLLVGTNDMVFQGISFANATRFQRLAPSASQQVALRQEARPARSTTVPSLRRLDAGTAYTIVITGARDAWNALVVRDDVSAALATRAGAAVSASPDSAGSMQNR